MQSPADMLARTSESFLSILLVAFADPEMQVWKPVFREHEPGGGNSRCVSTRLCSPYTPADLLSPDRSPALDGLRSSMFRHFLSS